MNIEHQKSNRSNIDIRTIFSEPDFSAIKMGSRVLAKQSNKLWHRAVVLRIPETEKDDYTVKFEASGTILELGLHDLFPLSE